MEGGLTETLSAVLVVIGTTVTPFVTSLLKNPAWPKMAKQLLVLVLAVVTAILTVAIDQGWGAIDFNTLVTSGGLVWAAAVTSYRNLWEDQFIEPGLASVKVPVLHSVIKPAAGNDWDPS